MLSKPHATLIVTGYGLLGQALTRIARSMGHEVRVISASDTGSSPSVWTSPTWLQRTIRPATQGAGHLIHTAAMTSVLGCEREPRAAEVMNTEITEIISELVTDVGLQMTFISTDWVFDGKLGGYKESAPKGPINTYGMTKAVAEDSVLANDGLVIRGSFIGSRPDGKVGLREILQADTAPRVGRDRRSNPLHVDVFARKVLELTLSGSAGVRHLGSATSTNWTCLCSEARFRMTGDPTILPAIEDSVPRPYDTTLSTEHLLWQQDPPTIQSTIAEFCGEEPALLGGPGNPNASISGRMDNLTPTHSGSATRGRVQGTLRSKTSELGATHSNRI